MDRHRAAWEDWGRVDPFWAVLTEPAGRFGRWDADRFFATGVDAVATMLELAGRHGRPVRRGVAMDFGCGLGRLTRGLAPHFDRVVGLDVASTMIEQARQLDAERGASGAEFVVHDRDDLSAYESGSIDFVLCLLVLQHLPTRDAITTYLREFVRVLAPGGAAVLQLPVHVPPPETGSRVRRWLRPRTRLAGALRAVGVSPKLLYERFRWNPAMRMLAVPAETTAAVVEDAGGSVLAVTPTPPDHLGVVSHYYLLARSADARPPG